MNNDLYDLADQLGITVLSFPLPNCKSLSLENKDDYYIGIDEKQLESSKEERVHIAHELGHCVTGSFYNEFSPIDNRGKCEATADRWAVRKLVDKDILISLLKSGMDVWEIAEYFNVTEDFIRKSYYLYFEVQMAVSDYSTK